MASPELTLIEAGQWREAHRYSRSLTIWGPAGKAVASVSKASMSITTLDGSNPFELRYIEQEIIEISRVWGLSYRLSFFGGGGTCLPLSVWRSVDICQSPLLPPRGTSPAEPC